MIDKETLHEEIIVPQVHVIFCEMPARPLFPGVNPKTEVINCPMCKQQMLLHSLLHTHKICQEVELWTGYKNAYQPETILQEKQL